MVASGSGASNPIVHALSQRHIKALMDAMRDIGAALRSNDVRTGRCVEQSRPGLQSAPPVIDPCTAEAGGTPP